MCRIFFFQNYIINTFLWNDIMFLFYYITQTKILKLQTWKAHVQLVSQIHTQKKRKKKWNIIYIKHLQSLSLFCFIGSTSIRTGTFEACWILMMILTSILVWVLVIFLRSLRDGYNGLLGCKSFKSPNPMALLKDKVQIQFFKKVNVIHV